jgi:hypothetical protein
MIASGTHSRISIPQPDDILKISSLAWAGLVLFLCNPFEFMNLDTRGCCNIIISDVNKTFLKKRGTPPGMD